VEVEKHSAEQFTVSLLVMIITMPVSSNGGRPALPDICTIKTLAQNDILSIKECN
jgi:hypothetical protein